NNHNYKFTYITRVISEKEKKLNALCTWWDVLATAQADGSFDAGTLSEVRKVLEAPAAWSVAHGGKGGEAPA
ncbi:MAG: orotate phosphoribosyltransferase, partial [Rhodospirillales bacterium]